MPRHTCVAALALALALSVTPVPGATAGTAATRTVTIGAVEARDDVFVARGSVDPEYADRVVVMQRKLRRERSWSTWKKFRTSEASSYRRRIAQLRRPGIVCYRVKVRASGEYPDAYSSRVCIRTYRA